MIRVLIVDDSPLTLIGIRRILEMRGEEIEIIGEAYTQKEVMNFLKDAPVKPDVILLDISLEEDSDGIRTANEVAEKYPDIAVIMLSHHKNMEYMFRAFRAKAYGYLAKDSQPEDILNAVLWANSQGGIYLGETISRKDMQKSFENIRSESTVNLFKLSDREIEIIRLLACGYSTKQIAEMLCVTSSTIETHKDNIKSKTGKKSIIEIVVLTIQNKLIDINKLP